MLPGFLWCWEIRVLGVLYIGVLYLIFYGGFGKIGLRFANLAL
nr:MAG TPA: hypothetical protein [Caudoviricetes sp.]